MTREQQPYIHLRTHTEYSVVDGILRIDALAQAARDDGQGALAITDLGNLFGAVKFYRACISAGVKPIIGTDVWMEPTDAAGDKQASRLVLLVQNTQGYLNLCQLLARAWTTNAQRAQAWVKWDWLQELGDGLIALSGADLGAVGQALIAGDKARAKGLAKQLATTFPGRFYLELQRADLPTNTAHVVAACQLAAALKLPVVATHPVQFQVPDDYEAHEARVCVAEGETLANPRRVKRFTREQYFKTQAQLNELFADVPSALANTVAIAKRCNLTLDIGNARLPDFPTPHGEAPEAFFRDESFVGLERRLAQRFPEATKRDAERPAYAARLEFELNTIVKMGFPGYFLIVADFIGWARKNGCPVGPGRGSGAGSLVAYSLGITDLDPLQYNLLFERFLNPERVSMPDFDIDFCRDNRERVIDYVKDKYGRDAVGQIVTFGTMAAKAALRDVGRVLGMGYGQVDAIAKLIPAPPGKTVTLALVPDKPDDGIIYARKEAPELEVREKADEEVAELLSLAARVEGIVRNVGMHAGGVLIAPGKITDFCPLYQQPGSDSAVSQYDKDDVEAIGLVKFDFLGLATLTILEQAKKLIELRHPELAGFSFDDVPLDDARVYKLFSEGRTEAVFQFESRGMQGMLRDAKPNRIEDLFALNAMFRPGPMENIPSFCARKHGREAVSYPHPLLAKVLDETYGIFVYQEQVMQAAQMMAGYSLGGADMLRRAMGKKKAEEMAQQRQIFRDGALAKGIERPKADEVFDLMEKFAGYGFNKSHAAAYSLLAYHTAWVKVHHPEAFYAANMTVEMGDTDKLRALMVDAKTFGVVFDAPDVNEGTHAFEPVGDKRVRYGLGAVKGTGQGAIEAIVAARRPEGSSTDDPYRSLFDFCARVDRQRVNKRVIEALIKAGAFDKLHADRSSALASVGLAMEWADSQASHIDQGGLFDFDDSHAASTNEPALIEGPTWSIRERLSLEKSALGLLLSGHLFDQVQPEVRQFLKRPLADVIESRDTQWLAGIVSDLRFVNGNRGRVAIFKLDDNTDAMEAVADERVFTASADWLRDDEPVVLQGRVEADRFGGGSIRIKVQRCLDMAAARVEFGKFMAVTVNGVAPPVNEVLQRWPGRRVSSGSSGEESTTHGLTVRLLLRRQAVTAQVDLGAMSRFWPSDEALAHWREHAPGGLARIVYGDQGEQG
jgi:DNA polymerase III subunit alpha